MIISVIVPVRNDRRIEECLNSLIHQDFPRDQYEILVVDNGSTDPEIPQIIQKFPVRYISEPRIGSYAARNSGIDQASGRILAFTDSDCILPATWLPTIKEHFEKKCCRICVGRSYSSQDSIVSKWIQSIDDVRSTKLLDQQIVNYFDTRNVAAFREIFLKDRFDSTFVSAGDLEFGLRITNQGERIHFLQQLEVEHRHSASLFAALKRGIRRGKGIARLQEKYGSFLFIDGEREWKFRNINLKSHLLRLTQNRFFCWLLLPAVVLANASLFVVLIVMKYAAPNSAITRSWFNYFDRSSLLLGRLLR
ncbi:MAG: hypothetical protein C5B54_11140 [Acidobacteria bacterium]|nr:MAG: hypothetical protein C5B54_11140 [Acidobacteriota bacterium]